MPRPQDQVRRPAAVYALPHRRDWEQVSAPDGPYHLTHSCTVRLKARPKRYVDSLTPAAPRSLPHTLPHALCATRRRRPRHG